MHKFFPGDLVCQVSHISPTYKKYKVGVVKKIGNTKGCFVKYEDERDPMWTMAAFLWFVTRDEAGNIKAVKQRPPAPRDTPVQIPEKPVREEEPEEEEVKIMRPSKASTFEAPKDPPVKSEVQQKVEALSAAGYDPFQVWQDMLRQAADLGKNLLENQSTAVDQAHEAYLKAREEVEQAKKLLSECEDRVRTAEAVWKAEADKLTVLSQKVGKR